MTTQQHNTSQKKRWEVVIGLETHAQLLTTSKLFSSSATHFGVAPNLQANAIDLALPGVLPVLNRAAVEHAIRFGLALGATITRSSIFARKNYFYPDLPKGYQISQFELPVVQGGKLLIQVEEKKNSKKKGDEIAESYTKEIHLTRAHLEEDAGKSIHTQYPGMSGIDLNRAGTPLLEIVTEPEMRSASEAVAYAKTLHNLVTWLGICDGNMQEGSFRCDANVSVRPVGQTTLGTRCEIKNLNSFRFLEEAIDYEVQRQIAVIEDGEQVIQETRLYDPDLRETRSMRSKEDAQDYRYFPDPDLLPLIIDETWIERVRTTMPALPHTLQQRFTQDLGLSAYDATLLTQTRAMASYFEEVIKHTGPKLAKLAANWVTGELSSTLRQHNLRYEEARVSPMQCAALVQHIDKGTLSNTSAKTLFGILWDAPGEKGFSLDMSEDTQSALQNKNTVGGALEKKEAVPESASWIHEQEKIAALITTHGLAQLSDDSALEKMIDQVLQANPKSIEEFHAGKERALNALVGQIMKASQGKANPQRVNDLLRKKLSIL